MMALCCEVLLDDRLLLKMTEQDGKRAVVQNRQMG